MMSDTGLCDRRARRSSTSMTSSACVRLKQPVRPSRRLVSRSSRNSCALRSEMPSRVAAAASVRRRPSLNGPELSGTPRTPTVWPPAVIGTQKWPAAVTGSVAPSIWSLTSARSAMSARATSTSRCASRAALPSACQYPSLRIITHASSLLASCGRCCRTTSRIVSTSSARPSAWPNITRRSISLARALASCASASAAAARAFDSQRLLV